MCGPSMAARFRGWESCACGCCGCGCGPRSSRGSAPQMEHERLERYRAQLEKELAGIAERIKGCTCE